MPAVSRPAVEPGNRDHEKVNINVKLTIRITAKVAGVLRREGTEEAPSPSQCMVVIAGLKPLSMV